MFKLKRREKMDETIRKRNKKKKMWCEADEDFLIDLWKEKIDDLRTSGRRDKTSYYEMVDEMQRLGRSYSVEEVRVKLHNLTNRYKKELKLMNSSGVPCEWHPFHKIHNIIGRGNESSKETVTEEYIPEFHPGNIKEESFDDFEEVNTIQINQNCGTPEKITQPTEPVHPESSSEASENNVSDTYRKPRKRKSGSVIKSLLQEYKNTNSIIMEERRQIRKVDFEMLKIEKERNDILREFMKNAKDFQDNVAKMLSDKSVKILDNKVEV